MAKPIDSSLKKNTAFIKRVRQNLNGDNQQSLLKDISSISLERYLSEITSAVTEGLLKCKATADVRAAVEVSKLYQYISIY